MPYGEMAKLKSSAKNAEAYLEARRKLELEGKYNPAIEQYAGKGLDQFSTVNDGIWDRMSPVPYQNMADFTKSYYDNIKPKTTAMSKNGISYTKSEISEQDLYDVANGRFNDIINTPQGRLMYKMYKDQLGSDDAARKALVDAVVSGNRDRLFYSDNYEDNYFKHQTLALQKEQLAWTKYKDQIEL